MKWEAFRLQAPVTKATRHSLRVFAILIPVLLWCSSPSAHHVLGRPAYSLNEDSNTPPSMQVETQIGNYFVTYMVFPAFPKSNQRGRINLYATHIDTGTPFQGEVTFKVRDDGWFQTKQEILGVQPSDDNVYRQGFVFLNDGDYIITAEYEADGEPYVIDFPLRIGAPSGNAPIVGAVILVFIVLVTVSVLQRKRLLRTKIRSARQETQT